MKYLIHVAWELDGHAGSEVIFVKNKKEVEREIKNFLSYTNSDDGQVYLDGEIIHKSTNELGVSNYYGEYSGGAFSIQVMRFSTYRELFNIKAFTRTG